MSDFIPTENIILVSILCRKMPGLFKCILQYSTPPGKKASASTKLLSAQQIQEARLHPSTTVQQTLKVIANIQSILKKASAKLDTIEEQRDILESTLTKLRSLGNKDQ
jgi:hypothetical protein